jgi:hypothetical protein
MENVSIGMKHRTYTEHKQTPKLNGWGIAIAVSGIILLILLS